MATKIEPSNDEDVVYKAYLDTKLSKIEDQISSNGKDYNDIKGFERSNKQLAEQFLFETVVKSTRQILFDKGLFNRYDNADEVLKAILLIEFNERRKLDLDPIKPFVTK